MRVRTSSSVCTAHPRSDARAVMPGQVTPRSRRDRLQIAAAALLQSKRKKSSKKGEKKHISNKNRRRGMPPLPSQPVVVLVFIRELVSVAVATVRFFFRQTGNERATCFLAVPSPSFPFKDVKWKRRPSPGDSESLLSGRGAERRVGRQRRRLGSCRCAVAGSAHQYVRLDRLQSGTLSECQSCGCQRNKISYLNFSLGKDALLESDYRKR